MQHLSSHVALTAPDVPKPPDEHNIPLFLKSRRQGTNFGNQQCFQHVPTTNCSLPTPTANCAQEGLLVSRGRTKALGHWRSSASPGPGLVPRRPTGSHTTGTTGEIKNSLQHCWPKPTHWSTTSQGARRNIRPTAFSSPLHPRSKCPHCWEKKKL